LRDELKRTWTGFYGHFLVTVSKETLQPERVLLKVKAPEEITGGQQFPVSVTVVNEYNTSIQLVNASFTPLPGMKLVRAPALPPTLEPGENVTLNYTLTAPFAYRDGFVSYVLKYFASQTRSIAESFRVTVVWEPWNASDETLMKAYGGEYHWIIDGYLVDGYWVKKFNSTSYINRESLALIGLKVINGSRSDVDAAGKVFNWILSNYSLGDVTTTLQPEKILPQDRISYAEAQILATAILRSVNIPARVVTLFNGTDCTIMPITEFYTTDGWYVIDFRHRFIGTLDSYVASPYFPRIYQLVTKGQYRIVAQSPLTLVGHEHIDVTAQFTDNLENRLVNQVLERVRPNLRSKLTLLLGEMPSDERIFALFLFSSAPSNDLNRILDEWSANKIEKTVKAVYEFYKDMPWKEDFTYYWKIFAGEVP
jgi:hypothetical protein